MKCTNCGKEISDTAKVCGYCGHQLKAAHVPTPAPIQTPIIEPKRKPTSWIWIIAALGSLLLIGLVVVAIILFVPIKINLGLSPNAPAPAVPTNPPPPVSTSVPTTLTDPAQIINPSAEPTQYTSPTAARMKIVVEPFRNENDGTRLSDLAQETGPGKWTANISSNTSVILAWGWCTATEDILEQNLQHMQILFYVDGTDVTSSMTISRGENQGYPCQNYRGVIRSWPWGKHTIIFKMVFLQKVNDGENDYEGENIKTYTIKVSE